VSCCGVLFLGHGREEREKEAAGLMDGRGERGDGWVIRVRARENE
jgi:hypothetical protein